MVAYDSRRVLDPAQRLSKATLDALRDALVQQLSAGSEPTDALRVATHRTANEARVRGILPDSLLMQLDELLASIIPRTGAPAAGRGSRESLIFACLRALYDASPENPGD